MVAASRITQLRKIVKLYVGAKSPGERNAALFAFRRRKVGTPYAHYTIDEFLSLGDAVPLHPWPRRRNSTPPTLTPEQREARRLAAEQYQREMAERHEARKRQEEEEARQIRAIYQRIAAEYAQLAKERARKQAAAAHARSFIGKRRKTASGTGAEGLA